MPEIPGRPMVATYKQRVTFLLNFTMQAPVPSETTETKLTLDNTEETGAVALPPGVGYYEVNGPLFFGAAESAMEALHASRGDTFDVLVLDLSRAPVIDATGFCFATLTAW